MNFMQPTSVPHLVKDLKNIKGEKGSDLTAVGDCKYVFGEPG